MAKTKSKPKYVQRTATITLPDGTQKRIKEYGKTEREALLKLAKRKADYEAGKLILTGKSTFAAYAKKYMEVYKAPTVKPYTLSGIQRKLDLYFLPYLGQLQLDKITTMDIQQCFNRMQEANLSQDYLKKSYYLIFSILDQARKDRLIIYNNAENCTIPKCKPPQTRRALTEDERRLFLAACEQTEKGVMYLTSYYCGLRPGEVRALRWCDIDLPNATLSVNHTIETNTERLTTPKSQAGYRTIKIPDALLRKLQKLPAPIHQDYFVFGQGPKHCSKQRYERGFRHIKYLMDILAGAKTYRNQIIEPVIDPNISPYYLRHTYCTRLAEEQVDIKVAQYLMGHSSIEMTSKIYTHVNAKILHNADPTLKAL